MRRRDKNLLLTLVVICLFVSGCSTTLHEKKASEVDPGSKTQLKLMGPKVKVVHDF